MAPALASPALAQSFQLRVYRDGNVFEVANGATIQMQAPSVSSDVQITISAVYFGSQSAAISRTDLLGPAEFTLQGTASPNLKPGDAYTFTVHYRPASSAFEQALLSVSYQEGSAVANFRLTLAGSAPELAVSYSLADHTARPLSNGGEIVLPIPAPGSTSQATVTLSNVGSGPAVIRAVGTSGPPFDILDRPILPATLAAGQSLSFSVRLNPASADSNTGSVRIDGPGDPLIFTIRTDASAGPGTGTSAALGFAFTSPEGEKKVDPNGTITVPATAIGASGRVDVIVRNLTAQPFDVGQIGVADPKSAFHLATAIQVPLTLAAQQEFRFQVSFSPQTTGVLSGPLVIGASQFTLQGVALPPTKLPAANLIGPQGAIDPLHQDFVSIALQEPYAIDVVGVLSLAFDPGAAADPSLQFSSGGRTVSFKIAAGDLRARFTNGNDRIGIQTGSIAGRIRLSASMQTVANYDLTPPTPPTLDLQIPASAPSILSVTLLTSTTGTYAIRVLGMTTNRQLNQLDVQFVPTGRIELKSTAFTLDVSASAASWFRDVSSLQFGGLFSVSIPLALNLPKDAASLTVADVIRSIGVSAANDLGSSPMSKVDLN